MIISKHRTYRRNIRGFLPAALAIALAMGALTGTPVSARAQQPPVNLGNARSYAVMAGTAVINTGLTRVVGRLGVSPGTSVTGFPPGIVFGRVHRGDSEAASAMADVVAAYADIAGRAPDATVQAELGGTAMAPGLYESVGGGFTINGTLTLDAQGTPGAVFIFRADTLTTAGVSNINLVGGAQENHVFWEVDSATLGTYSVFRGNILALKSIMVGAGAVLHSHAFAINETVIIQGTPRRPATHLALPDRPPTATTLASSLNPSTAGQAVTFTATVRAIAGSIVPTGRVIFRDGSTIIGVARHGSGVPAVFTTSSLAVGEHRITAVYLGGKTALNEAWISFAPSVSPVLIQTVNS